ncbi:MAG: SPOR domain-containing protein [Candidatus Acidiferrum sp.]
MASGGKRGSAGERVLEGRHVIGLFMLMLLFSGLFFTLGFEMGRNQYDGQVRAATNLRGVPDDEVQPKPEVAPKPSKKKSSPDSQTDTATPNSDWEFYHAVDSNKTNDELKPVATPPAPVAGKSVGNAKPGSAISKTIAGTALNLNGGINLQVAALTKKADALALANNLRKKNFPTFVQTPQGDKYYHVLVGPYADQKAVDNARKGLEEAGFKAIVKH